MQENTEVQVPLCPFHNSGMSKPGKWACQKNAFTINIFQYISKQTPYLSVLDFLKSLFHKIDFWTWFLQTTQAVKIKFEIDKKQVKKSILWNRDFKKSSTDR